MSWIVKSDLNWYQRFFVNIIKSGQVPKHVAFIMDGNRRYAKKTNLEKIQAHAKGFDKMIKIIEWCKELGISEITVYAFSIENFKRSKQEVDGLMSLAQNKIEAFLDEIDDVMKKGLCIRVIGNLSYLSPKLKQLIAKMTILTENNTKCFLNIAFPYSSRDEITNSIKCIKDGVDLGFLEITDIDEQLISKCLYTNKSPDPDLLIRTSGEMRFSDFLLWQITSTQVFFVDVLWPESSIWLLLAAVFKYQINYCEMLSVKKAKMIIGNNNCNSRVDKFLKHLEQSRRKELESFL